MVVVGAPRRSAVNDESRMSVAKARTGSWKDTLEELVRNKGAQLHRYALLLTGSPEDAADLVQEALVRAFGRLSNGFTVEKAEGYVRRIILNTHLDQTRRRRRWHRIVPLAARPEAVPETSSATDERLDLAGRLQRLSPRERACIVLRYYEDLKVDDIAERLELSPGTVKRYLSDALAKLAVSLGDETGDEGRALSGGSHAH